MPDAPTYWKSYEQVARHLLDQVAGRFGLREVQGKQTVPGSDGGSWEIDAKGILENGEGFVIVECRRYTKSRVCQEEMGGLAYRIRDTGAAGGIIVSPLELQAGAKRIASREGIAHVRLAAESTTVDYMFQFLKNLFVGMASPVALSDSLDATVVRANGTVEPKTS